MGSRKAGEALPFGDDFAHIHDVELSGFQMSRFLVTNAQYLAYCEATGREPPQSPRGWGDYLRHMPNHPVVNVNYNDAEDYAKWLAKLTGRNYQLPTEARWEFAARAGADDGRLFLWGDEWDSEAANTSTWYIGDVVDRDAWKEWWDREGQTMSKSRPMTTRVGSFKPNAWGFYDMTGNVWEWMSDWYEADYYARSPAKDPPGPSSGDEKVLRGCSWYNKPDVCFIATRDRYAPDLRLYYNGFRVVADNES
jgi:formylglycine-generating enzyme required for sulfatase activity